MTYSEDGQAETVERLGNAADIVTAFAIAKSDAIAMHGWNDLDDDDGDGYDLHVS